jgi:hypothetical protein
MSRAAPDAITFLPRRPTVRDGLGDFMIAPVGQQATALVRRQMIGSPTKRSRAVRRVGTTAIVCGAALSAKFWGPGSPVPGTPLASKVCASRSSRGALGRSVGSGIALVVHASHHRLVQLDTQKPDETIRRRLPSPDGEQFCGQTIASRVCDPHPANIDGSSARYAYDVAPLDSRLQTPLSGVLTRMANDARATAAKATKAGVSEVDWIEDFHALVAQNLAAELYDKIRLAGLRLSISVATALVHGNPFQVDPLWRHGISPAVEISDLLLVGERHDASGVAERQALLLQMKVGLVKLRRPSVSGAARQAALFSEWPPITWSKRSTRDELPGPFPRTPAPGPCDAAQFGIIPDAGTWPATSFEALPLAGGPRFAQPRSLTAEMARTLRLDLGVDATPGPVDGWSRIVEDILRVAPPATFRAVGGSASASPTTNEHRRIGGASRGRFAVIVVGFGPPGVLD